MKLKSNRRYSGIVPLKDLEMKVKHFESKIYQSFSMI